MEKVRIESLIYRSMVELHEHETKQRPTIAGRALLSLYGVSI